MCFLRLSFVYHRSSVCFVLLCYLFSDSHLIHLIHLFSQATQYIQHDQVCLRLDDCAIDVEPFTFIFSLASGLFSLFSLSRLFLHFKHHMVDYWRSAMLGIIFVIAHTRNEKKHTLIMTMLRCTLRKIVYVISLHRLRCHLHAWNLQFRRVFNAFVIRQHFTRLLAIGTMISEVSHRSRNWINFEWKKKTHDENGLFRKTDENRWKCWSKSKAHENVDALWQFSRNSKLKQANETKFDARTLSSWPPISKMILENLEFRWQFVNSRDTCKFLFNFFRLPCNFQAENFLFCWYKTKNVAKIFDENLNEFLKRVTINSQKIWDTRCVLLDSFIWAYHETSNRKCSAVSH